MEQNYIVFTDKKKLVFGSYEHHTCEILPKNNELNTLEGWENLHNLQADVFYVFEDFEQWKSNFRIIRAAGGIVLNNQCVLMIFRNNCWDLPKGWIETDEFPLQGAMREVIEECGQLTLTVESLTPIITYHLYVLKGKVVLKETHWFRMSATDNYQLVPQIKEGINKVEFIPLTGVEQYLTTSFPLIKGLWQDGHFS